MHRSSPVAAPVGQDRLWLVAGTGEGPPLAAALLQRGWRVRVSVVTAAAVRAYQTLHEGEYDPRKIARFLNLDKRLPRSLSFCYGKIADNLEYLAEDYGQRMPSHAMVQRLSDRFASTTIDQIFDYGLHEFVTEFLADSQELGRQIEIDYRFYE